MHWGANDHVEFSATVESCFPLRSDGNPPVNETLTREGGDASEATRRRVKCWPMLVME